MCCAVVVETTVLVVTGRVTGPLWFDLLSAGSLLVAIRVGAEAFLYLFGSRVGATLLTQS
jgi:hypothetical protein